MLGNDFGIEIFTGKETMADPFSNIFGQSDNNSRIYPGNDRSTCPNCNPVMELELNLEVFKTYIL